MSKNKSNLTEIPESLLIEFRKKPTKFIRDVLGVTLEDYQKEIVTDIFNPENRINTYVTCHAVGKTFTTGICAVAFLLLYPNSLVLMTASARRQVLNGLIANSKEVLKRANVNFTDALTINQMEIKVNGSDKWKIFGFTSDENSDSAAQGLHADHMMIFMDEGAGIGDNIYDQMQGCATASGPGVINNIVVLGNPTNINNRFYEMSKIPHYNSKKISAFDTPNFKRFDIQMEHIRDGSWKQIVGDTPYPSPYLISPAYVYDQYLQFGEDSLQFQTRVLANFPEKDTSSMFTKKMIADAMRNYPEKHEGPIYMGLDVSGTVMGDETVLCVARPSGVEEFITIKTVVPTQIIAEVISVIKRYEARGDKVMYCNIDTAGIGLGTYQQAISIRGKYGKYFKSFNGANKSSLIEHKYKDSVQKYNNRRSEAYFNLMNIMKFDRFYLPENRYIESELLATQIDPYKNHLGLISKKDISKLIKGRSPDYADALSMAMLDIRDDKLSIVERMRILNGI